MGIIGAGFIGPHHVDAVRRLGFVDVVALADVNEGLAKDKAAA
jgi:predicted dehydrogenase